MAETYDVIVLGAGPTGENVASRAIRGGLTAAIVESELVGGECSYWACIQSKTLLRPGEAVHQARAATATAQVDPAAALAWRDFMVSDYSDAGQQEWLASKGIDQRLIDDFVGHMSEEQRRRYRHLWPSVKENAIAQVFG